MKRPGPAFFTRKPLVLARVLPVLLVLALLFQAGTFALSVLHGLRAEGLTPVLTADKATPDDLVLICTTTGLKWVKISTLSADPSHHAPLAQNLKPFCPFCILGASAPLLGHGPALTPPRVAAQQALAMVGAPLPPFSLRMAWPFSQGPPA